MSDGTSTSTSGQAGQPPGSAVWSWTSVPSARLCGWAALIGLVLLIVGIAVGVTAKEDDTVTGVAVVLITGGFVVATFGVVFFLTAEWARLDASGGFDARRGRWAPKRLELGAADVVVVTRMSSTSTFHSDHGSTPVRRHALFIEARRGDSDGSTEGESAGQGVALSRFPAKRDGELCAALRAFAPEVTYEDRGHVGPR